MQASAQETALAAFLHRVGTTLSSVLLLDYDGTLAPFHVDRNIAYPYPGIVAILQQIVERGRTQVIIVSGRPVAELRNLLAPLSSLELYGAHGTEHQSTDGRYSRIQVSAETAAALAEAEAWLAAVGLSAHAEVKLGGIALHWRGMPPLEAARVEALTRQGWSPLAQQSGFKLLQFEAGLELRVPHPDKGDAVRSILAGLDPDVPVAYLGDDLTDEDAFHALNGRGLPILVKTDYRETVAGAWLKPPQELTAFLECWLSSISG